MAVGPGVAVTASQGREAVAMARAALEAAQMGVAALEEVVVWEVAPKEVADSEAVGGVMEKVC